MCLLLLLTNFQCVYMCYLPICNTFTCVTCNVCLHVLLTNFFNARFANAASQLDGSGNPIVSATKSIITGAGTVIGSVGNTVFKPNEQSEALSVIKQNDPEFALDKFLNSVQYNVIPDMMKAYFTDDMETVKRYVTDSCWKSYFYPLMEARRQMNYRFDSKVLDITDVEVCIFFFSPPST